MRQPTWTQGLSNKALLDEYDIAYDASGGRNPAALVRLDILNAEICRRERVGSLTHDDWKIEQDCDAHEPPPRVT